MSDGHGDTQNKIQNKKNNEAVGVHQPYPKGISDLPFSSYIMAYIPEGCVFVARKIQDNKIWKKPSWWFKIFCYLIMEVSYKEKKNPRGTGFFKYSTIYNDCYLEKDTKTKANVDNVIRFMRKEGICTTQKTTRGIYISLCNYGYYQNIHNYKNETKDETGTRQERDRNETITNKRVLKGIKGNSKRGKRFSPPTYEEVSKYCKERKNTIDAGRFIDFYSAKGWYIGKNKMKDWKAAVRTWENKSKKGGLDKW